MNSFKDCCDNACCAQAGNDNFGGFGSSGFRPRRFSFYRDQCQDVPPSGFKNMGSAFVPSGNVRGTVYANLNGDIVGRLSGKIDGIPTILSSMGGIGNFGNCGLSLPFSVQFGERSL